MKVKQKISILLQKGSPFRHSKYIHTASKYKVYLKKNGRGKYLTKHKDRLFQEACGNRLTAAI